MISLRKASQHVRLIERRIERLDYLVENWAGPKPDGKGYALAERATLRWALDLINERLAHRAAGHAGRPYDAEELLRWAESYGHPEEWAKRAQRAYARADRLLVRVQQLERQLGIESPGELVAAEPQEGT